MNFFFLHIVCYEELTVRDSDLNTLQIISEFTVRLIIII
jgi:hypothetical protein